MNGIEKLTHIRALNQTLGLPHQENKACIFNGGFFDIPTLVDDPIVMPPYPFQHPLSAYPQAEQSVLIHQYGVLLGIANGLKTVSVGALDPRPSDLFVTLDTREVNRAGCWTLVQRTVFLFNPLPFYTTDFVAASHLLAKPGEVRPPADTDFRRLPDLGPPNAN